MYLPSFSYSVFLARVWRLRGWKEALRHLREQHCNHARVLSRDPAVVLLVWGRDDRHLHTLLRDRDLVILYLFFWDIESEIATIAEQVRERTRALPRHRIMMLCNEPSQAERFIAAGVEALFVNQNALVDETVFCPTNNRPAIRWDAIYNAMLSPFKRIELAARVQRLCMITYKFPGSFLPDYMKTVKEAVPQAWWANDELASGGKLHGYQVADLVRQSVCGLCLSEVEGAMFASMEYLMCGVPVVSTPSRGGRSVFFDERTSLMCEANPEAIAEAVYHWSNLSIDPDFVRQITLSKVTEHRQRLSEFLRQVGACVDIPWYPTIQFQSMGQIARTILLPPDAI